MRGWRSDSYRHGLAAKGQRSSYDWSLTFPRARSYAASKDDDVKGMIKYELKEQKKDEEMLKGALETTKLMRADARKNRDIFREQEIEEHESELRQELAMVEGNMKVLERREKMLGDY